LVVVTAVTDVLAGLSVRRPRPGDRDALLALCRADEQAATGASSTTAAEIDELLNPAHTRLDDDQWVVVDGSRMVGYCLVWDHGRTDHQDVDVYRDPSLGSERLREAMLDLVLRRVAERARLAGYPRIVTGAGCYAEDEQYATTLRSRGFAHVRTFHHLRVDLDPSSPVVPTPPTGVDVIAFDGDEQGWRDLHAVVDASFTEHWGYVPVTYEAYRADIDAEPHPDRPMWRVAVADGRMVGVARASGRNAEVGGGWVSELAVLPQYRGRGVARALLQAAFEANRQAGRHWVGLGVDTQNGTGAVRLYESVGMVTERQIHAYQRDVLPT
jgi:ribosomal protein S18 acetylase RimI-like enzyme